MYFCIFVIFYQYEFAKIRKLTILYSKMFHRHQTEILTSEFSLTIFFPLFVCLCLSICLYLTPTLYLCLSICLYLTPTLYLSLSYSHSQSLSLYLSLSYSHSVSLCTISGCRVEERLPILLNVMLRSTLPPSRYSMGKMVEFGGLD